MPCPEPPYADLEYADQYFSCIPGSSWDEFCEDDQKAALVAAAYQLDTRYGPCYMAYVYVDPDDPSADEDFEFLQPRDGYTSADGRAISAGAIAKTVKNATCLLALSILTKVDDDYSSDNDNDNGDIHAGRRVKSFSQDSPDIFNESYTYYDDGVAVSDLDATFSKLDVIMAPHLEPGCCPGEPCDDGNGLFVSEVCLG